MSPRPVPNDPPPGPEVRLVTHPREAEIGDRIAYRDLLPWARFADVPVWQAALAVQRGRLYEDNSRYVAYSKGMTFARRGLYGDYWERIE